jgi:hypothetical protein
MKYPEEHENARNVWKETVSISPKWFRRALHVTYTVLEHREMMHWCGYVRFASRPLIEQDYDGIAEYVPVHGGITWASDAGEDGMVYGFDCGHAGDDKDEKTRNMQWLMQECRNMAVGIFLAAQYEKRYLHAKTNKEKALVLDQYHADLDENYHISFDLTDNFGAMINMLGGSL